MPYFLHFCFVFGGRYRSLKAFHFENRSYSREDFSHCTGIILKNYSVDCKLLIIEVRAGNAG